MCLIILFSDTRKQRLNKKYIENAFKHNKDGLGLCVVKNKKIFAYKYMPKDENEAYKIVKKHYEESDSMAVHFRMGTQGLISIENTHPFTIAKDVYFMHNGVFSNMPYDSIDSDTKILVDRIKWLGLSKEKLFSNEFEDLFLSIIGASNKVLMITNDSFKIFNSQGWYKERGVMYSNKYSLDDPFQKWDGGFYDWKGYKKNKKKKYDWKDDWKLESENEKDPFFWDDGIEKQPMGY